MNGLHIKPSWQPAIPAEQRSFTAFFHPILPQLAAFHWIYPDTIPFSGDDADFERLIETSCSEGYIPPDTLLPRFARCVAKDWANLYGFEQHPDLATVRRRLQSSPADYDWMSQNVDVCVFNVDGAWWEIYARDESLLGIVRKHVAGLPDIAIQERHLARRDILA